VNQSAGHDALARRAAQSSIVLLKNDGLLPLSRDLRRIAVIGPTADEVMSLLGNYYGTPAAPVTVLEGIRQALPRAEVVHAHGAHLVEGREDPRAVPAIDSRHLRAADEAGSPGLKGEYFRGREFSGEPAFTRIDPRIDFRWDRDAPTAGPAPAAGMGLPGDDFSVRWTGTLLPPVSGRYELGVAANDGFRLYLDDRLVLGAWETSPRLRGDHVAVDLEAGREYTLRLEYFEDIRDAEVRLTWRLPGSKDMFEEAIDAARSADAVVFVGGLTGDVEGEEMEVSFPGFAGGDRTDLRLPAPQQRLLEALQATGKPVVLVLTTGSALALDWAQAHVPAILVAWYPGQQGGRAVADVLFGDANPAGRLPVTFYKDGEVLPAFDDYAMAGRTYRYFEGEALYPFGHGLSYSRFEYSDLRLDRRTAGPAEQVAVSVTVRNAGVRAGDEVVQLYLRPLSPQRPRAIKALRGFQRLHLQPGEQRVVRFVFTPEVDLAHHDPERGKAGVDAGDYEVQVGASSGDIRQAAAFRVQTEAVAETPR
jgi:beta-glucosidase